MTPRPWACLISCGKAKLDHAAEARDLYTSELFRKSRAYAERFYPAWGILSAKHGLLRPGDVIEPYDLELSDLTPDERRAWGIRLGIAITDAFPRFNVTLLAGELYAAAIRSHDPYEPLRGKQIGERLHWLKSALGAPEPEQLVRVTGYRRPHYRPLDGAQRHLFHP